MSLQLIHVRHAYGGRQALEDVNLEIRAGDCYGFIGHNGAGKTTAMRIALGLIRPSGGRALVDGHDCLKDPLEARARMGGLIEQPGFFDYWTGPRNLHLLGRLQGMSAVDLKEHIPETMERVGLGHVLDLPVRAYSQGMRQRLGIAQALLGKPRYLLLDEPSNGLDPEGLAEMRRLLVRLTRDEGLTVLLSSHQLHEVAEICNRIAVLKKGRVLLEADAEEILLGQTSVYQLVTPDVEKARQIIASAPCRLVSDDGGVIRVDVEEFGPAALSRTLVEEGVALESLSRQAPSLEEIYLELAEPKKSATSEPKVESPAETMAPGRPLLRAMGYEFRRLTSRWFLPLMLVLPFAVAWWDIHQRWSMAREAAGKVADGSIMTTTDVTAFEGVVWGLRTSLLLMAMVFCGLASQSLASELERGTLRNALLRPLSRLHLGLGKILTLLGFSTLSYLALTAFVCGISAWYFDYTALVEILPNGETEALTDLETLKTALTSALSAGLLPTLTYTVIGFLAGALARTATAALVFSIGGVFALESLRVFLPTREDEFWLPPAHMPSKLGDHSFLRHFEDVVTGLSNAAESMSQWPLLVWCGISLVVSFIVLSRRSVR